MVNRLKKVGIYLFILIVGVLASFNIFIAPIHADDLAAEENGWILYPATGHYYRLTGPKQSWFEAENQALEWGGHLVTINNVDENEWLVSTFGSSDTFWIGYTDKDIEGVWEWVSGENSTYTNWYQHHKGDWEPNDCEPGEDAVGINYPEGENEYGPGKWNDLNVDSIMRGIVEKTITELPKGKIVFVSDRDGNNEIYIMNTDGSEQTRLTNTPAGEEWPSFSPDGSKVAFQSNRDGNFEVYIMNIDGSEQKNLTNSPKNDGVPSFSPDGSKIVFSSDRDGNGEIYIMNIDGSGQTNLTNTREWDLCPYLSLDGTKIAYRSDRGTNGETYAFSPDDDVNWEIYIMNVDGSGQTRLTNNQVWDWEPKFSPDGSKIVYCSVLPDKNGEIYIMNVDGSKQTNLTNNPAEKEMDPSFLPGGSKIAFASSRDGNSEIYIMNVDGSGQTRLTNNPANDREPCFYFGESKVKAVDELEPFRPSSSFTPEITRRIPTFIDTVKTEQKVIYANVLLAILTMIPFAVASELFNSILSENEEDLKRKIRKIRPVAYLRRLNEKIKKIMGAKTGRHLIARNVAQMFCVILFYGLAYSLLDPAWKPFSKPFSIKVLTLLLDMAIVYGIVGIAGDIFKWHTLKKWGVPAGFSVQPKNLFVSVISISASRLLALVPGMMFGAPAALQVDKSTLDIAKRDRLSKISFITLLVIGSGLWSLTTVTELIQKHYQSGTLHDSIGGIEGFLLIGFAVALQNTFFQMLGFPGGFGHTMRQRNRWVWFIGLVAITFVFYLTLINPRSGLVEAFQKTGVIVFLSIAFTFIVVTFGLWLHFYFRKKHRLP